MTKSYKHFDHKERTLIYWWRKENLSRGEITRRVQRSHSSISRELRRNLWCILRYFPRGAQMLYDSGVQRRATRYRLKSKPVRDYVHQKLQIGWTQELISGRLTQQGDLPSVCQESIYQYMYCLATQLIGYLPRHHHKRKPKRPYRKTGEQIKNRTSVGCAR